MGKKISLKAVITSDLLASSLYEKEDRKLINTCLKEFASTKTKKKKAEYLVYRGDNLQGLLQDPTAALRDALILKSLIKSVKLSDPKRSTQVDIRISIGIGGIDYLGDSLLDSDGEAFQNSGRTLDSMKKSGRTLALTTSDELVNMKWDALISLLEEVIQNWTLASAEIVYHLLQDHDDKAVMKKLKISQPAVSLRKKHAGWDAISKALDYYKVAFDGDFS